MATFAPFNFMHRQQQSSSLVGTLYGAWHSSESRGSAACVRDALSDSGIENWISRMVSSMPMQMMPGTSSTEEEEHMEGWGGDMEYSWLRHHARSDGHNIESRFDEENFCEVSEILQWGAQTILVDQEHYCAASSESKLPPSILAGFL